MKLTDEQKLEKQKRDNITRLKNRILSEYQFKKWRNFHSYLSSIGRDKDFIDKQPDRQLTFDELKGLLNDFQEEALREHPSVAEVQEGKAKALSGNDRQIPYSSGHAESRLPDIQVPKVEEETFNASNNYGLKESKKEVANLLWFQKLATAQLLKGLLEKHLTGQYLIAAPGSGKTYVIGALLRRLIDINWHKKDCMSPWPIIYVTKASVVTQTRRVLETEFGVDTLNEVTVLGIDQLRARFGQMFVKERMQIIAGEEHYYYEWSPMINPKLIIWDESHMLKNYSSTQHKIGISYSSLPGVYQIFSSATPATRVSEFKAFVLACHLEYDLY